MTSDQYTAFIPDLDYYQQTVKCQSACPVRTDARGYRPPAPRIMWATLPNHMALGLT